MSAAGAPGVRLPWLVVGGAAPRLLAGKRARHAAECGLQRTAGVAGAWPSGVFAVCWQFSGCATGCGAVLAQESCAGRVVVAVAVCELAAGYAIAVGGREPGGHQACAQGTGGAGAGLPQT